MKNGKKKKLSAANESNKTDSEVHKIAGSEKGPESILNVVRFELKSRKRELLNDRKRK